MGIDSESVESKEEKQIFMPHWRTEQLFQSKLERYSFHIPAQGQIVAKVELGFVLRTVVTLLCIIYR